MTVSLALSACGPGGEFGNPEALDDGFDSIGSEIVGGVDEPGYDAVVAIANSRSAFCSGTLIAPQTVLTAGHCWSSGSGFQVWFGPKTSATTKKVTVTEWIRHPSYRESPLPFADVSIMKLSEPVTDIKPIPIDDGDFTEADIGKLVRHVGYGLNDGTAGTGFGTKRQVVYGIRQILEETIESGDTGKQTCNGDSGGPAFITRPGSSEERVAATVSYGDSRCVQTGYDARVDVYRKWIQETMSKWEGGTPPPPPPPPPDEDTVKPEAAVVSPTQGTVLRPNSTVRVVATAKDNVGLARVELNWAFSNASFDCSKPPSGVTCSNTGDRYTWTLRVGSGKRNFSVTATDTNGNQTTTPTVTVEFKR